MQFSVEPMITTKVRGRLGNQMFQYAFTRLTAERLGLDYRFAGNMDQFRDMFPHIQLNLLDLTAVNAQGNVDENVHEVNKNNPVYGDLETDELARIPPGSAQEFDLFGYFENAELYWPHRDQIKSWFNLKLQPSTTPVYNVRGCESREKTLEEIACYKEALSVIEKSGIVVTDDPTWSFVNGFGIPVQHGIYQEDFLAVASAPEIVIGRSTFSWWAAFLSNAKRVWQPEPRVSWRSKQNFPHAYLGCPGWEKVSID